MQKKVRRSLTTTNSFANSAEIHIEKGPEHRVYYRSGGTVYVEAIRGDRWVGEWWSAQGGVRRKQFWESPAFEMRIKVSLSGDDPEIVMRDDWKWQSAAELPKTDRGARHFVVELSHPEPVNQALAVRVHTLLDGTPVLTRWIEITNRSNGPIALHGVSPWAGQLWAQDAPVYVGYWTKRSWAWEAWFDWKRLRRGENVIRNDTDMPWDDPNFLLRNEAKNEYFFGQLAWAANYEMTFHKGNGLSFRIAPIASKALRVIAPGETVCAPSVHLGGVKGSFDLAVQAMHEHIRRSVLPRCNPERAYRSQYLCPGDWSICHYYDQSFNEENMMKVVDVATAAALEVFILDGPTWCSGYGNWLVPNPERFPRGLGPLRDYIHQKNMLFGLYFESEGGRDGNSEPGVAAPMGCWRESQVYRDHPEWFDRINLNLAIPEAAQYLESELGRIIEHYQLDLYRHDENSIVFCPPGVGGVPSRRGWLHESNHWRHYEALYEIFRRVHAKYPNVILQQASAGGYRLDLGTIAAFHEHMSSDHGGNIRRLPGISVFLPPECVVNPIGLPPNDPFDLATWLRAAYAMGHTPVFFTTALPGKMEDFKPEDQAKHRHHADLYKRFIRPLLATCKVYHHEPVNATGGVESGDWVVMEFMAPDRSKGWATIINLSKAEGMYLFKPKGLNRQCKYTVTFDNTGRQETLTGSTLMQDGLEIRTEPNRCSELILMKAM